MGLMDGSGQLPGPTALTLPQGQRPDEVTNAVITMCGITHLPNILYDVNIIFLGVVGLAATAFVIAMRPAARANDGPLQIWEMV